MDEPPVTRDSLILRLRDPADAVAWRQFVELYEPLVYKLARCKGLQDADAHDLCQQVLLAVAGAVHRWDPEPSRGHFRSWLFRIARNLMVNFLTRQYIPRGSGATSVQELLEAQPTDDPSATDLFDAEYQRRVFRWAAEEIRSEFAPSTWKAFWLTAVEGRSPKDVACKLSLSVGAVYTARSRILARLRQQVELVIDETITFVREGEACDPE